MTKELDLWRGEFGNGYTTRNTIQEDQLIARKQMWGGILQCLSNYGLPESILEVGAGAGINIQAIDEVCNVLDRKPRLMAIEPNEKAFSMLIDQNICKGLYRTDNLDVLASSSVDLVFTSGVLIHINPNDLSKKMNDIYRVSKHYVLCIEYFSPECREIKYRGQDGALWANDFGGLYLDNFALQCIGYGFLWKRMTGLDDLTWTLFRKVH